MSNLTTKRIHFLPLLALLLFACQPKPSETSNMVSVSILPQKYFVDQISGNTLKVNVLIPPGASPHNYEALPSQMKDLAQSAVWLQIGLLGFEEAWEEKLSETNKNLAIVNCSEGIVPISGNEHEHEGHNQGHQANHDPHVWLAPNEAKILAHNTLVALTKCFPGNAPVFEKNFEQFARRIDSLSVAIDTTLKPLKNRNILIFHPALAYYARQFGLEQIALEYEGKEPSPKHIKDIVDLAREQGIRNIFIQKEFDTANAQQLAREIGGTVTVLDQLDYEWEKQMLKITREIAAQP